MQQNQGRYLKPTIIYSVILGRIHVSAGALVAGMNGVEDVFFFRPVLFLHDNIRRGEKGV